MTFVVRNLGHSRRGKLKNDSSSGKSFSGPTNPLFSPAVSGSGAKPRLSTWLLARISHHLTVEARNRPVTTALRLLAVLNVLSRSGAEGKSLLISVAPRYERATLHPQKYASARRASRA